MYACLAVTCHLHFWQNDRDFLRATAVTRGWNGYRNKSQHRKSTLEKKILPPFQQGFEPATFQSRVRCSNHWAIPAPQQLSSAKTIYIAQPLDKFLQLCSSSFSLDPLPTMLHSLSHKEVGWNPKEEEVLQKCMRIKHLTHCNEDYAGTARLQITWVLFEGGSIFRSTCIIIRLPSSACRVNNVLVVNTFLNHQNVLRSYPLADRTFLKSRKHQFSSTVMRSQS